MGKCNHWITQRDKCVECGGTVYTTETRACSECTCFRITSANIFGNISTCKKKLMTVLPDMHVYYKIDEGTCFES